MARSNRKRRGRSRKKPKSPSPEPSLPDEEKVKEPAPAREEIEAAEKKPEPVEEPKLPGPGAEEGEPVSAPRASAPPPARPSLRIGLSGASGFIGRAIIEVARDAGHEVVGFSRSPERSVPGTVEMREFSRPDQADYRGLDAFIHLAGEPIFGLWTEEKKRLIFESRIGGTRALVRGIEKLRSSERPKCFVCASAVGLYGDTGDTVVDEDSDAGFGFLSEVVRGWEAAAREAGDIGLRSVSVRIGFVLGRTGGALPLLRKIFRAWLGGRLGSGRQWMPWVHVRDVARIFLAAVENPIFEGAVNAVSPHSVTNAAFTEALAGVLDRPAFLPAPAFVLKRAPGGMGELFLNSQRVDPAVLRLREFEWEFPDLESALREALPGPDSRAGE